MAHFFPADEFPAPSPSHAPDDVYHGAHKYFQIGYTDVVLRNPATGEIFLPTRAIEPEKGSIWFVGGRTNAGETTQESAARHVEDDTGLSIAPGSFSEVSHFGIAHVTPRVRDAKNTVLVANLKPDEVSKLNSTVSEGGLSKEYESGKWYDPKTVKRETLPAPVRQFLRDYFDHQTMISALQDAAEEEKVRLEELAGTHNTGKAK